MESKICVNCKSEKSVLEFYLKKNGRYHSWCNDCRKNKKKEWDTIYRNKVLEYRDETKEHKKIKDKEYRENRKDELKIKSIFYNKINREKRRIQRLTPEARQREYQRGKDWRIKNKDKYNNYFKEYYTKFPERKIIHNLMTKLNKLVDGSIKSLHCNDLVGCDIIFFKNHIESQFKDGMSWENYGFGDDKWHIDHIRPCRSFNIHDPEEQRLCFLYTNLQPLWQAENISKGAHYNGVDYRGKPK